MYFAISLLIVGDKILAFMHWYAFEFGLGFGRFVLDVIPLINFSRHEQQKSRVTLPKF